MTKEQLEQANRLKMEIFHVQYSLDNLGPIVGESYPHGQKNLGKMNYVLAGLFDVDIYRMRCKAHLEDLEKQLADL